MVYISMYYKGTAPIPRRRPIVIRAVLVFAPVVSLLAQYPAPEASPTGFAVTDDGNQLYFVSSLELRGSTGETTAPKLLKLVNGAYSLVQSPPQSPWVMLEPRVSGDGTVIGYVASNGCGRSCNLNYPTMAYETVLQFPGSAAPVTIPYYCQISKNAHYALCVLAEPALQQVAIVNLQTMQMSAPQLTACNSVNLITSAGQALAWNEQQPVLFNAAGAESLPFDNMVGCPVISDDGSTIAFVSKQGLNVYNVADRAVTILNLQIGTLSIDGISNDGSAILANGVLYQTSGAGFITLSNSTSSGPVFADVLAGNGSFAWGRFIQFDAHGNANNYTDPTPTFTYAGFLQAPGSYFVLQGQNLSSTTGQAASFPGPMTLAGVQVKINGTAVPLISVSPTSVSFQIPWEMPDINTTVELDTSVTSQLTEGPLPLYLAAFAPYVLAPPFTEDFSAENSFSNPANPGDIVNFYMTGLGPVSPAAIDSVPASSLSTITTPITVSYGPTPLRIYYAGLAPGLIGIYQLTVQTPAQVAANGKSGPASVQLDLQQSPPQAVVGVLLDVWMNTNQ